MRKQHNETEKACLKKNQTKYSCKTNKQTNKQKSVKEQKISFTQGDPKTINK